MTKNALWLKIDGAHVTRCLEDASARLETCEGEAVLDFSGVNRIDTNEVHALEEFAAKAAAASVKPVLHGVQANVYRVLMLMNLAPRFSM
ncbi:MAG TPA: STAS domain-containing protein [Bryobacteraceae bacterium]|nr:STAS domain-containing protein [Bryobacteraceae bacterium]